MGLSDLMDVDDVGTSNGNAAPDAYEDFDMDDLFGEVGQEFTELETLLDIGELNLKNLCKKAATQFFNEFGLISHQINSYNDFISNGLQRVFDSFGEVLVEPGYDPSKRGDGDWRYASIKFGEVSLVKPIFWAESDSVNSERKMLPRDARLQNMTYAAKIKVQVKFQVYTQKQIESDKAKTGADKILHKEILRDETTDVIIGSLPVMVKSDLCWMKTEDKADCDFDQGGYFVIKGAEKVFIAQEQICMKRLWIVSSPQWSVGYKSEAKRNRLIVKLSGSSKPGEKKVLMVYFLSTEVPLWLLFFALGVKSDKEVVDLIDYDKDDPNVTNILIASIQEADNYESFRKERKALVYLDESIHQTQFPPSERMDDCIQAYLFPSLQHPKQKAQFLGYMVKCLLLASTGHRRVDNRDNIRNKRLELAGELLERELKAHLLNSQKRMKKALQKALDDGRLIQPISLYLDASVVTNGLSRAFSTGAWCHPWKKMERVSGVVANLGRTNPLQTIMDLRRTRQQVLYTGKVGDTRYPHPSHWGRVCFLSTPDGENCGLVKNLSITGIVSTTTTTPLIDMLTNCGMDQLSEDYTMVDGNYKVFLNGEWVGVCGNSHSFVKKLRCMRRKKRLPHEVEVKRDEEQQEVRIFSDAGRILRPLLVVANLERITSFKGDSYTFQSLLDKGIIEFIGTEEEEDCSTAWGIKYLLKPATDGKNAVKYTHCELDMSFLLGVSCGIVPFANHDHARRVLYQSQKHCQQAIGYSTTNPNIRTDTLTHQLFYPQRPLFRTTTSDCLGDGPLRPRPELFNGQNCIVAVNAHMGYNQEDSLVMNRASLERGMFRTEHIRSYKAEVDNKEDKRRKSDDVVQFGKIPSKFGRVDSLEDDGFPYIGADLQSGDIVVGKCGESGADYSIKLKHTERGKVQKVVLSANDEGKNFAVVSLRQVRTPSLGDKFSSMHGQKGVLGFIESQENFPFTVQGIVPDVVINPHAFPSRQTPGQLLEAALAKGIASGGTMKYATPFSTTSVESITDQLHRAGFSRWGGERVYNGRTGEKVESLIFMGPTFYQRLVHMAEDKVKFRNTGAVHPLTRQPVADRKRFGGIKFGEMERDCLIAHGAAANLYERVYTLSDSSQVHICQSCKNIANVIQRSVPNGRKVRGPYCRVCSSADDIVKVNIPYGAKLLCQELFSMGISLKFDTKIC
ncbi:DNA-directed RNA polymerases IV and V subunit 2 [Linum grandiflorum]